MALRTLIFDFDGTIADSFAATLHVANSLAPEFGYRAATADELHELRSQGYRQIALQLGISWHKIPRIVQRMRSELRRTVTELHTFAGLPEALRELRNRGIALGILTSNDRDNVERFLAARDLPPFDFVSCSASLWGKERRLKSLMKSMRLAAHEVAYVGDEVRDIEATRALNVRMIAVDWGFSTRALLAAHSPDHLLSRPDELLELPGIKPV
jgi:phosphoglycolate phosphatase